MIARDSSEHEAAVARKTQEYNDDYHEMTDQLAKVPKDKAVKACVAYLEGSK